MTLKSLIFSEISDQILHCLLNLVFISAALLALPLEKYKDSDVEILLDNLGLQRYCSPQKVLIKTVAYAGIRTVLSTILSWRICVPIISSPFKIIIL